MTMCIITLKKCGISWAIVNLLLVLLYIRASSTIIGQSIDNCAWILSFMWKYVKEKEVFFKNIYSTRYILSGSFFISLVRFLQISLATLIRISLVMFILKSFVMFLWIYLAMLNSLRYPWLTSSSNWNLWLYFSAISW